MCKRITEHSKLDNSVLNSTTMLPDIEHFNKKLDDEIVSIINQVSLINIKSKVETISSYHTRHTKSVHINEAAEWLKNEFKKIRYGDISFHKYKDFYIYSMREPGSFKNIK
jgi:isopentenyl phosphate kinase